MKKLLLLLILPLLAITFNSCSSDDGGGGPTVSKLVKKISYVIDSELVGYTEFEYDDQQRISKIVDSDPYCVGIVTYHNNTIVIEWNMEYSEEPSVITYTLDNGYIVQSRSGSVITDYTYTDGYLTSIISDSDDIYNNTTYTWSNGNLVEGQRGSGYTLTYTYTDKANKEFSVNLWHDLGWLVAKGNRSKNLIASVTGCYSNGYEEFKHTYTYRYDSDGYPTQCHITRTKNGAYLDTMVDYITYY